MNTVLVEILNADKQTVAARVVSSADQCLTPFEAQAYRAVASSPAIGVPIYFGSNHKLTPLDSSLMG